MTDPVQNVVPTPDNDKCNPASHPSLQAGRCQLHAFLICYKNINFQITWNNMYILLFLVFWGGGGGLKLKFSNRGNFKLVKSCQCEKLSPGLANLQLTTQETHLQVAVYQ